ncbi:MAG: ABC transporter substrate-binding protein, partial [Thermoprotei archaeon]
GIEYPQFIQEHGGVQGNGTENTYVDANGAPGTGPYIVSSWIHGQSITLTLNPYYWGPKPHVSKVVIEYVTNTLDAINDLKSGSAQMLYTVPFNLLPDINGTQGVTLESHGLSYDIAWLSLNTQAYPLNITDVRLAINYAINKTQIINKVLYGYGVPFQGPIPIGMFGHNNSIMPIGYNLSKAKQLLSQAGFPDGKGIPPLTLLYYTGDPVVLATVQIIQSDLAQIGITVTLEGVTQATYFNIAATVPRVSNYPDILWSVWFPDFAYPDDYAYSFENINSVFDNSNINNTLLNLWTSEALNSANFTQQALLYSKITQLDKQLGDNVWLWQSIVGYGVPAYLSSVHNVYWNPILYGYNYSALYIYPYS